MPARRLRGTALVLSAVACASAPGLALGEEGAPAAASRGEPEPADDTNATPPPEADEPAAWETADAERRGGFSIGVAAGAGLGASNGYPADSRKIGLERYYTESGLGFAGASSVWIGGALADWLNFGVGMGFSTIRNGDTTSPAPLIVFHTDVYPLYGLATRCAAPTTLAGAGDADVLCDLGVMGELGLGFPKTTSNDTEETLVDGTGASYLFLGGFWEGIHLWQLRMGPYAGVHYMWSETIRRPAAIFGFRTALYTSP